MKKTLVITALCAVTSLSAMAQGTATFANFGGGNNFPVRLVGGAVSGAADGVLVDLFYGSTANNLVSRGLKVQIQGNGLFTSTATGNLNPVDIPGIASGSPAFFKMVAWQGGTSYGDAANTSRAESAVFSVAALGGGTSPTPNIPFGTGSLQLAPTVVVPEPSTIALAVLGLSGLLLVARRRA